MPLAINFVTLRVISWIVSCLQSADKLMTKSLFGFTVVFVLLLGASSTFVQAQRDVGVRPTDSGGPLMPEQAAYDIKSYDLDLRINPAEQSIKGVLTAQALIVHPTAWFVLDLDPPLTVDSVALVNPTGNPPSTQL